MVDPHVQNAIESLGSIAQAAEKLGVSKSLIYKVLSGKREPSDDLLRDLGLSRVTIITGAK